MKRKKPTGKPDPASEISAADFPALRAFLRGYLHEDWPEEFSSAAEAARQFTEEADAEERKQVAREWQKFRERTKTESLDAINRILAQKLGACWQVADATELEAVSLIFRP